MYRSAKNPETGPAHARPLAKDRFPAMTTLPGGGSILVLDDDVHVAETLQMILLARGYKVRIANSAEEAIETIAAWEPDLAIVDVMLPRMNGIEFGEVLRSQLSHLPPGVRFRPSRHLRAAGIGTQGWPSSTRDPAQAAAPERNPGDGSGPAAGRSRRRRSAFSASLIQTLLSS